MLQLMFLRGNANNVQNLNFLPWNIVTSGLTANPALSSRVSGTHRWFGVALISDNFKVELEECVRPSFSSGNGKGQNSSKLLWTQNTWPKSQLVALEIVKKKKTPLAMIQSANKNNLVYPKRPKNGKVLDLPSEKRRREKNAFFVRPMSRSGFCCIKHTFN